MNRPDRRKPRGVKEDNRKSPFAEMPRIVGPSKRHRVSDRLKMESIAAAAEEELPVQEDYPSFEEQDDYDLFRSNNSDNDEDCTQQSEDNSSGNEAFDEGNQYNDKDDELLLEQESTAFEAHIASGHFHETPTAPSPVGAPIVVRNLQQYDYVHHRIKKHPYFAQVFSRTVCWMELNTNFREVNYISNKEALVQKGKKIFPNIPQYAQTWLDREAKPPKEKEFVVTCDEGRVSIRYVSQVADLESSILNIVCCNLQNGVEPLLEFSQCGSMGDVNQTQYFEAGVDTKPNKEKCRLVLVSFFSDGTSLNNSFEDTLHPIIVEVAYCRSFMSAHYKRTNLVVGWFPRVPTLPVTRNGKPETWNLLTSSEKEELTKKMHAQILGHLRDQMLTIANNIYVLPHNVGRVRFRVYQYKCDTPEKRMVANCTSACYVCSKPKQLMVGNNFLLSSQHGTMAKHGADPALWNPTITTQEVFDALYAIDVMHLLDNVIWHSRRIVGFCIAFGKASKAYTGQLGEMDDKMSRHVLNP